MKLGPTNEPTCPKCSNSFQNGIPADSPNRRRCASCKYVWELLKRGDKLYKINHEGDLEIVTFIKEGLADSTCTETVYTLKQFDGRQFQCCKNMYVSSIVTVYSQYLEECLEAMESARAGLKQAENHVRYVEHEIERVRFIISEKQRKEAAC